MKLYDGSLIDPARCARAEAARPAGWRLVRTNNGTAITGTYAERNARALVYLVRADEEQSPEASLPEVQATYVVTRAAASTLSAIEAALDVRTVPVGDFGTLDAFGHAALGPVPIVSTWSPVDEYVDNTGLIGSHAPRAGRLLLVGGGWIVFADEARCCGFRLQPKPWRVLDSSRVGKEISTEAQPTGLEATITSDATADVWGCRLGSGISYEMRDAAESLRGAGAFWTDTFEQIWRIHYWLETAHSNALVRALRDCAASTLRSTR